MTTELAKPKKRKKRRPYPPKHREKLAKIAKKRKPWQNSTGPRTPEGKTVSAKNGVKHGLRSAEIAELKRVLRLQARYIRAINARLPEKFP